MFARFRVISWMALVRAGKNETKPFDDWDISPRRRFDVYAPVISSSNKFVLKRFAYTREPDNGVNKFWELQK